MKAIDLDEIMINGQWYVKRDREPNRKGSMVDLPFHYTLANFCEYIGIKLWQGMAMGKYFKQKTNPTKGRD